MRRAAAGALVALLPVSACGAASGQDRDALTVLAAASLTESFTEIARAFEVEHPGTTVVLDLGASSALAARVVAGARADVLATASPATMQTAVDAGAAREPRMFARNALQIAVPPDDPGGVTGLADFARDELDVALCAEQVPCGAAAAALFAATGVVPAPDTLEQDVRAVLTKVRLGEVDAGLVYRTDVRAAGGDVRGVDVPEAAALPSDYPVAVLTGAADADGAEAFVAHVLSQEGQRVLARAGFDAP